MRTPLLLALLTACAHRPSPADALAQAAIQVATAPAPSAALGEMLAFPAPVAAAVYNTGQDAQSALVADRLADLVPPADLEAAADQGARAALGASADGPATVQLSIDQWGVHADLPGEPGALEVTVRARLLRPGVAPVRARPLTCAVDLADLAPGERRALDALDATDPTALSAAAAALAADCAGQAVAELRRVVSRGSSWG